MIEVLKFSATWCGPCRMLSQALEGIEGITNIDIDLQPKLAVEYNIRNIPIIIFKVNDKIVHRQAGLLTKKQYKSLIKEIQNSKELWEND